MSVHEELGIYKVRLPLPFRLNHINSYAIKGTSGWQIIDTGLNTEPCRTKWLEFLADHQIEPSDIKGIFLTHSHPDHYGGAGWLQQLTGAPVYVSKTETVTIQKVWQGTSKLYIDSVEELFANNGMPAELAAKASRVIEGLLPSTKPAPDLTIIEPGISVQMGDYQYSVISTPGHSDGHICYFNEEYGILFSGDHLLPKITSNIALWPEGAPDPLDNYLKSLHSNRGLCCKTVLPSHGESFGDLELRISELEEHHKVRLSLMKNFVQTGSTVYEVCRQVFTQDLNLHELRFAITETLAHLMYLVYRGELQLTNNQGVNFFSAAR